MRPLLLIAALLPACRAPPPRGAGHAGAAPDTGADTAAAPDCPEGQVRDGEACVPAACGVGPWGELDPAAFDLFVDAAAPAGGDGGASAPLASLDAALERLGGTGAVALAAGTYPTPPAGLAPVDLRIAGRCRALVTLTHSGAPGAEPQTLRVDGPGGVLALSGVRVTGGILGGVWVAGGTALLSRVEVADNDQMGLVAVSDDAVVVVHDVVVRGTTPAGDAGSVGVLVASGAAVLGGDLRSEDHLDHALQLQGSGRVSLTRAVLRGTERLETQNTPTEEVSGGGNLECWDCLIEDALADGVVADGPGARVRLHRTRVRRLRPEPGGAFAGAVGLWATNGGDLEAWDCEVADVAGDGLVAGEDAHLGFHGGSVHDVVLPESGAMVAAAGAVATWRGSLLLDGVALHDIEGWGVLALDEGARVAATDLDLSRVGRAASGAWSAGEAAGGGVAAGAGGEVSLTGLVARDLAGPALLASGGRVEARQVDVHGIVPTVPTSEAGVLAGPAVRVGEGGAVDLSEARLAGAVGTAVQVAAGTAALAGVGVAHTRPAGDDPVGLDLRVEQGGRLEARAVVLESAAATGLEVVGAGSSALLADSRLAPSTGHGVLVRDGGRLDLVDSTVEGRTTLGRAVDGAGSVLTVQDGAVAGTRDGPTVQMAAAVAVLGGAEAELAGLSATGDAGVGLFVHAATAGCTGCTIEDEELVGVYVRAGDLSLVDTRIAGTRAVAGQGGFGLVLDALDAAPRLVLDGVEIVDHPTVGAWLRGPAHVVVRDSVLGGGPAWPLHPELRVHGDALVATGGLADLALVDTTVRDAGGVGLLLDASTARLDGVRFEANALDLLQQACADAPGTPPVGVDQAGTVALCPEAERPLLDPDLSFFVDLGGVLSD